MQAETNKTKIKENYKILVKIAYYLQISLGKQNSDINLLSVPLSKWVKSHYNNLKSVMKILKNNCLNQQSCFKCKIILKLKHTSLWIHFKFPNGKGLGKT